MLEAGKTYVVIEDVRDERDGELLPPGEIFRLLAAVSEEKGVVFYHHVYEQEVAEVQALKHFDKLLTAAQEVVNDAVAGGTAEDQTVTVDRGVLSDLSTLIQKISDEAVEIIKGEAGK